MRGRKPQPTTWKFLTGNPGGRPINWNEPQPDALPTAIPDDLTDKVARAEWTRTIVPAILVGHITSADRTLALAHCDLFAIWRSQLASAAKSPYLVRRGVHRTLTPNPIRRMAQQTLQLLTQIDDKLGFSPTSRSKVAVRGPRTIRTAIDRQQTKPFDSFARG